jgi:hypothetical protein
MRYVGLLGLLACTPEAVEEVELVPDFPDPGAWELKGPGGPAVVSGAPFEACAYLNGNEDSADHHNHAVMYDGYLLMPWAPEDGGGGITFFDVSDPCAPTKVGEGWSDLMRESHSLGFSEVDGRRYVVVNYLHEDGFGGGVGFWDITDPTDPVWVSELAVEGYAYPDSYTRLTLSVFWQGDYVFASTAILGVFVIDASDPLNPEVVGRITFDGPHLVGSFHVWGNRALASTAGLGRTVLLDISDPLSPVPVPGGDWTLEDAEGNDRFYYFANMGAEHALFARSNEGGGPIVYDMTDENNPTWVSEAFTEDGDGGYVFQHNDRLFQGDSNFGTVYDFSDPTDLVELGRFDLPGDLDTVTPLGHVALVSVDEGARDRQATAVMPWTEEVDTMPPRAGLTSPADGETGVALTARIGVLMDEMIEPMSAFDGSFRVWAKDTEDALRGQFNVQENIVNFSPAEPLEPGTTYVVELPAGGLCDVSGNSTAERLRFSFTTED